MLIADILFASAFLVLIYLGAKRKTESSGSVPLLLGVLMVASTVLLTKTTARYMYFGVVFLTISYSMLKSRTKWSVISLLTFTSVFAMHGLLVAYTGDWVKMYPAMSPAIPINGIVLSLYLSDYTITFMVLVNLLAFALVIGATIKAMFSGNTRRELTKESFFNSLKLGLERLKSWKRASC
jgi:hypothetical protein